MTCADFSRDGQRKNKKEIRNRFESVFDACILLTKNKSRFAMNGRCLVDLSLAAQASSLVRLSSFHAYANKRRGGWWWWLVELPYLHGPESRRDVESPHIAKVLIVRVAAKHEDERVNHDHRRLIA
jgi:hypothetical protein